MPSLKQFEGCLIARLYPGGVRNKYGMRQVAMPLPKWLDTANGSDPLSPEIHRLSRSGLPAHTSCTWELFNMNHPLWFAISKGKQRFANFPSGDSIQDRS